MEAKKLYSLSDNPTHYFELWKYFTDDAQAVKDRMWTLATWLFAGMSALLTFAFEKGSFNQISSHNNLTFSTNGLAMLSCTVGFFMSIYSIFLLYMYGMHIRSAWNRADYLRRNIDGLSNVWQLGDITNIEKDLKTPSHSKEIPRVALWLIIIAACYGIIFIGLLVELSLAIEFS